MTPHEQALLFLQKAAQDEALIDEVLANPRVSDEIIGFHCQQAVEKLLKAVLAELAVHTHRTHNLRQLIDVLGDQGKALPQELQDLDRLTPFAVVWRYGSPPCPLSLDRRGTRDLVRALRAWAESHVPK
ncbi:MAG: HEPN domain-containing protein [Phycisphaerae bacterium]